MSAQSGISTFRDSGGLWENHPVEEVASIEGWYRNPGIMLDFYNERRAALQGVQPNKGHEILAGLEKSVLTLAKHQAENGQIPSNVVNDKASYGTHVGRTDATTWWIVTTCEYLTKTQNQKLKSSLKEKIYKK